MRTFRKRLLSALPVILVVSLLTFLAEQRGWLKGFDTTVYDAAFHLSRPAERKDIVMVAIDQQDYDSRFHRTSPLDVQELSILLQKIEAAHPLLIAVDIDTSAAQFKELPQLSNDLYIWAEGAADCCNKTMRGFGIAGGISPNHRGIALSEQDHDGVIRRLPVGYSICSDPGASDCAPQITPSFAWAIAQEYARRKPNAIPDTVRSHLLEENDKSEEERYFRRYLFSAPMSSRFVLAHDAEALNSSDLAGNVVIVGGTYCEGNDLHRTALADSTSGMQIVASQVAALTDRRGTISRIGETLMVVLDLLVGAILVFINYRFHHAPAKALLLSLLAIPCLALLVSCVVFSSMAFWANTVPVSISVLIHQFYEHTIEYRHLYLESKKKAEASTA